MTYSDARWTNIAVNRSVNIFDVDQLRIAVYSCDTFDDSIVEREPSEDEESEDHGRRKFRNDMYDYTLLCKERTANLPGSTSRNWTSESTDQTHQTGIVTSNRLLYCLYTTTYHLI